MKKASKINMNAAVAGAVLTILLAGALSGRADVPGILIKTSGQKLNGTIRWRPASRDYVVTTSSGVAMNVPANQVSGVKVQQPTDLEAAAKRVKSGAYAAAIPVLEKVVQDYEMLEWDIVAARWLAEAYLNMNNAEKAIGLCEKVIEGNPAAGVSGDLAGIYWDSLLKAKKERKLEEVLTQAVQSGGREVAAVAQIKRGDMDMQSGDFKKALIRGYLRTVILFESVKSVQPEALYKASKCFRELGRHSDAERMRKRLLAQFPDDPYTRKMKSEG